jgi:SulP family sulfate permease
MARALLASFADNLKLTDPDAPLTPRQWRVEILSGLTVALALVP